MNTLAFRSLFLAVALAPVWTMALAAARPPQDVALFVWFGAAPSGGLSSDGRQVLATVNGMTTMADYANGVENVQAIIQSTGNFRLNMQINARQSAFRRVCADFGAQLDGLSIQPLPPSYQCVIMEQPMHAYPTGDIPIQNLALNQQVRKLTRFAWTESGYRWRIGYGTDMDQNGVLDSPAVLVTCVELSRASAICGKWLMTPAESSGAAALYRFPVGKNGVDGPAEFVANVFMPFSMTFQRQ